MKKNAMLKIAAILMVAVLLTTCAISSTFAKYTTTLNGGNVSARVAKFGIEVDTTATISGFYTEYDAKTGSIKAVASAGTDNVFAPGTDGRIASTSAFKGTAEVAVEIETFYDIEVEGFNIGTQETPEIYFPIIFTVAGSDYMHKSVAPEGVTTNVYEDVADLLAAVEGATKGTKITVAANAAPTATNAQASAIDWRWDFAKASDTDDFNAKDTKLADVEAKITVTINATVTQIEAASKIPAPSQG